MQLLLNLATQSIFIPSLVLILGYPILSIMQFRYKLHLNLIEKLSITFVFGIGILAIIYSIIMSMFGKLSRSITLITIIIVILILYTLKFILSNKMRINRVNLSFKFHAKMNSYNFLLFLLFFLNLYFRLLYIAKTYPFLTGWDTRVYVKNVIWHTHEFPSYYPSGAPFDHSIFYMVAAIFYSIFGNYYTIEIFIAVFDSFSTFLIYLLYKIVSRNDGIAILGASMYTTSFFSFIENPSTVLT